MRSPPLALRIFAGLVLGLGAGAILSSMRSPALPALLAIAGPIGKLWLDALTMTVVPLVFALLVTGVAGAAGRAAGGRTAARAMLWFAVLLVLASAVSAVLSQGALSLWPPPAEGAAMQASAGPAPVVASAAEWFGGIIPTNPIKAAAETAMAPLVVFALLFGLAASRIAEPLRQPLLAVIEATAETMLVIVGWVLWIAPLGVLALAFTVASRTGAEAFGALLHYVVLVSAMCLSAAVLAYLAAVVFGRASLLAFAKAALPAQVVAVSTQSSLASLPAMVRAAPAIGCSEAAAGVVLPMAVSIFRAASAAANIAVAVYLAHLHGVALSVPVLVIGVLVTAAVSLAAVGLPAQVSFFATIGPVCLAMGVPIEVLPILLAVETIPDIFRTVGNVTADLAVARIVGRSAVAEAPQPVAAPS